MPFAAAVETAVPFDRAAWARENERRRRAGELPKKCHYCRKFTAATEVERLDIVDGQFKPVMRPWCGRC